MGDGDLQALRQGDVVRRIGRAGGRRFRSSSQAGERKNKPRGENNRFHVYRGGTGGAAEGAFVTGAGGVAVCLSVGGERGAPGDGEGESGGGVKRAGTDGDGETALFSGQSTNLSETARSRSAIASI